MKKLDLNKIKVLIPFCVFLALRRTADIFLMSDIPAVLRLRSFYSWETLDDFYSCILRTMEFFLLMVPMLNFYKRDFPTIVTYCITRNRKRSNWYYKKVLEVVCLSVIGTAVYSCTSLVVLMITKVLTFSQMADMIRIEISINILLCLYLMFFYLLFNTISLLMKQSWILPIGIATNLVMAVDLYTVQQNSNAKIVLNPMAHMFYPLHVECDGLFGTDSGAVIQSLNVTSSVIYFSVLIVLTVAAGHMIFRSLDLGLIKDE